MNRGKTNFFYLHWQLIYHLFEKGSTEPSDNSGDNENNKKKQRKKGLS